MKRILAFLLLGAIFAVASDCSSTSGQSRSESIRAALPPSAVDEHNPFGEPVAMDTRHSWTVLRRIGYDSALEHTIGRSRAG